MSYFLKNCCFVANFVDDSTNGNQHTNLTVYHFVCLELQTQLSNRNYGHIWFVEKSTPYKTFRLAFAAVSSLLNHDNFAIYY